MKKILVPTDFSDCARAAENLALDLAKKANAEIHFLHIFNSPFDWVKLPLEKEKLYPEIKHEFLKAERELNNLVKKATNKGLKVSQFLAFNKGREEIDKHIKEHEHDFIIMGSHGAKGAKVIIGSNTQKVVRYSNQPVLVVREDHKKLKVKNIVFASNFEEDVHISFKKIIEFADLLGASVHLLYVNTPFNFKETDEAETAIRKFLKTYPKDNCSINIYDALNEERGIMKFSNKISADLITMTTHGKTGFMQMISPSITEKIVNHSKLPVLSVNVNSK